MKNTKTTLAGLGAILIAVGGALRAAFDNDPSTNIDIASTIAAVTAPGSDLTGQPEQVVAIANAVWTPAAIAAYNANLKPTIQ